MKIGIAAFLLMLCTSSLASATPTRSTSGGLDRTPAADSHRMINVGADRILLLVGERGPTQDAREVEKTVRGIILYGPPIALLAFIINRWTRRVARKTPVTPDTSRIRFYGLMLLKMSWRTVVLCVLFVCAFATVYSAGSPSSQIAEKTEEGAAVATVLLVVFVPATVLLTSWAQTKRRFGERILTTIVDVKPNELRALLLAFVFNFVVLGGYYVIRPIRDEIGADRGVENLPWMYTGTLIGMLIANTLYAAIVGRMSRRRFIPIAYRFAIANLFVFFLLMRWMPAAQGRAVLAPIFFIWVSVFNLFATTMFWSFMADVFTPEQAKRLFGFIAVGGSLGGIVGGLVTSSLAGKLSTGLFLLITAVMLEIAAQCVRRFPTVFDDGCRASVSDAGVSQKRPTKTEEQPIGGKLWEGATHIARSPYLLGLAVFLMIYTLTNTWAYFQQADLTQHHLHDRAARTSFLANIDIAVNTITVLIQIFLTGRLMKWFGVGLTLVLMPLLSAVGFAAIGFAPVLTVLATFQILRRAAGFALLRPAREVLFTVLRREDKYKAKSLIDTFGYRFGDQIGAWSYPLMRWLGLGLVGISWVAVPIGAIWCALSIWLGRKQRQLAEAKRDQPAPLPGTAAPEAA